MNTEVRIQIIEDRIYRVILNEFGRIKGSFEAGQEGTFLIREFQFQLIRYPVGLYLRTEYDSRYMGMYPNFEEAEEMMNHYCAKILESRTKKY